MRRQQGRGFSVADRAEAVAYGRAWAERRWTRRPEQRVDGPLFALETGGPPYGRTPAFWQEVIAEARRWWVELQTNAKVVDNRSSSG